MAARPSPPFAVGVHVELETTFDESVAGAVFASTGQCLVLQQPGSSPFHSNVLLLKDACVRKIVDASVPSTPVSLRLPMVDPKRGAEREKKAIQAAAQEAAKIGVGVSREGQQIFDALAKTLPCRWEGKQIVVLEEVRTCGCCFRWACALPTGCLHMARPDHSSCRCLACCRSSLWSHMAQRTALALPPMMLPWPE